MRIISLLTIFSAVRCNEISVGGVGLKDTTGMRWETSGCVRNALWAMTEKMKFFVTPNFPMKYPDSVTCTWKMRTTGAKKIKIDWQVFWMDGCNDGNQVIVHDPKANKRKRSWTVISQTMKAQRIMISSQAKAKKRY